MRHVVAVDAGGTSTRAMVVDADARCLGIGRSGRGNPVSDGPEAAGASIRAAVTGALVSAGIPGDSVAAFSVAMAGGNTMSGRADWLRQPMDELGIAADVIVEPDLLAMFCSGGPQADGYALVSGTGSIAAIVRGGHVERFADGIGWLLGDTGSGYWLGREVARAVALALEGREPNTSMTAPVLRHFGIDHDSTLVNGHLKVLNDLVELVYAKSPLALAALAPIVFADPADPVSVDIVDRAATALADLVASVHDADLPGPLVIGGGVLNGQPRLAGATLAKLADSGIEPSVLTVGDGLVGAGVLVLRRLGLTVDDTNFATLQQSAAAQLARIALSA
ncbi:MAG: N-acetylglucosamine kinase [Beutenbergiaceae bacterium]